MTEESTIRVMIVDDHSVVRSGLGKFLMVNADLELVTEAESGEEAIQLCGLYHPDVILMDLMMPVLDGYAATRQIKAEHPAVRVAALTVHDDPQAREKARATACISNQHQMGLAIAMYRAGWRSRSVRKTRPVAASVTLPCAPAPTPR